MPREFCVLFCCLYSLTLPAQTPEALRIDSLNRVLPTLPQDTQRVKVLNSMSFLHFTIDPDEGIRIGKESEALAKRLDWKPGLAEAFRSLGANYWAKYDFVKAQACYWENLRINEALRDVKGTARAYHSLALIYDAQFNYSKTIEYYQRARERYEACGECWLEAGVHANLAATFLKMSDTSQAILYYQRAQQMMRICGSERDVAFMQGKIGTIYTLTGAYTWAMDSLTQSLEVLQHYPDKVDVATTIGDIALVQQRTGKIDAAIGSYRKALDIASSVSSARAAGLSAKLHYALGRLLLDEARRQQGRQRAGLSTAHFHLEYALNGGLDIGDKQTVSDAYQALSDLETALGHTADAFRYFRAHIRYRDSLDNQKLEREMIRQEYDYAFTKSRDSMAYLSRLQSLELEQVKQQSRIDTLKRRQWWLFTTLAVALLSLAGGIYLYRYRAQQFRLKSELLREKTAREQRESEHQRALSDLSFTALRSQMNPHFLFNTLNTIQGFIFNNDRRKAGHYLMLFSQMMRLILDHSRRSSITLREELDLLQMYLQLEQARFGDDLQVELDINTDIDSEAIDIPPMLVQPYAENAIKHGLLHKQGNRRFRLEVSRDTEPGYVRISVDDNGVGRLHSSQLHRSHKDHASFATGANEKRIAILNEYSDRKIFLETTDKFDDAGQPAGTRVTIRVPTHEQSAV